jgi:alpha/beta superfamily hydrolase
MRAGPAGSAASRLSAVTLEGPAGPLEGLLQERETDAPAVAAVLCHPHPLYGGTMHNKVVHRMGSALFDLGAAVLRFNFRGAGKSAGRHDGGVGELEDARAALGFVSGRFPGARRWVGGFSFGAWVAARLAASEPAVDRLLLVAPPVARPGFEVLRTSTVPKLIVQGTRDELCPLEELEREYPTWAEPKRLVKVEGAGHFFDRQLGALKQVLLEALTGEAGGETSQTT